MSLNKVLFGVGHVGIGWVMYGWRQGGSCRGGVGHVGVGWGGMSCRVGWGGWVM